MSGSNPIVQVSPPMVGVAAATEAGVAASQGASAGAASAALLGVLPMGGDPTSAAFAEALRAAGAAYLAAVAEHSAQRGMFAGGQSLVGATFEATEMIHAATATLGAAL